MDILGAAKDGLMNTLGQVEKAQLILIDAETIKSGDAQDNDNNIVYEKGVPIQKSGGTGSIGTSNLPSVGGGISNALSVANNIANAAGLDDIYNIGNLGKRMNSKTLNVQFNPESLRISCQRGVMEQNIGTTSGNTNGYEVKETPLRIYMDVNLVFNKVFPSDAFLEEKSVIGQLAQGSVRGVANAVDQIAGGGHSIRNEVEGLIAATRLYQSDLYLNFVWGELDYIGKLNNISAQYKMFNPKGEPIYGTVHLSMILIDDYNNNMGQYLWVDRYKKLLEMAGLDSGVSANTMSNKLGSLLNFSL